MHLSRPAAYGLLFSGMSLVGIYVALSKPLTAAFPVFVLAAIRFAIAAVAMLPWTFAPAGALPIPRGVRGTLFLQSLFGNFLFSICMLYGVSMTSATAAGVILSTLPAMVALLSWIFLREKLSRRAIAAVALAVIGIVVLQLARHGGEHGAEQSREAILGNLLVFGSVCCEAIYVILGKRLTATLSVMRISALINLWGLGLMLPLGLWQVRGFDLGGVTAGSWSLLVFYSLAASIFATWLWLTGLKHVPANHAGVFTVALPIASTVVGVAFLGESFTLAHAVAFACAATGVVLIAMRPRAGDETAASQGAAPLGPPI